MRILKLNLIAAAMLILGVGSASAYSVGMTSNYAGGILAGSDTVTVTVTFDTQGALNNNNRLMLMGVGVLFDSAVLAYDQAASSVPAIALGVAAAGNDLIPASTCPNTNPTYPTYGVYQCGLFAIAPAQVQLDFISNALASLGGVAANSAAGGNVIGTLVFHVIGTPDALGDSDIDLVFSSARGSALTTQTRPNISSPWTYVEHTPSLVGGPIDVLVPEPTTAVLIGLGLAGLGVAGRRRE